MVPSVARRSGNPTDGTNFKMDDSAGFGKRGLPKLRELLRRPRGESEVNLPLVARNVVDHLEQ